MQLIIDGQKGNRGNSAFLSFNSTECKVSAMHIHNEFLHMICLYDLLILTFGID